MLIWRLREQRHQLAEQGEGSQKETGHKGTGVGYLTLPNVTLASIIRKLSLNKQPMTREHQTGSRW